MVKIYKYILILLIALFFSAFTSNKSLEVNQLSIKEKESFIINIERRRRIKSIRILQVNVFDQGSFGDGVRGDIAIDVQQDICNEGEDDEFDEPFYETMVGLDVTNRSPYLVRFLNFRFKIRNLDGKGTHYKSKRLALADIGEVESEKTERMLAFLLAIRGRGKYIYPHQELVPTDVGARNVRFKLVGKRSDGRKFRIRAKTAFVFRNVNRCNG